MSALSPLHFVLQTETTWLEFYGRLLPEDVATIAEVDKYARGLIFLLHNQQHKAIVDAVFLNRIALSLYSLPNDVTLFSFLEKNIARTFIRDRTLQAVSEGTKTLLWMTCTLKDSPLSGAVLQAGAPCTEAEFQLALSEGKTHVVEAMLKHRNKKHISEAQLAGALNVWVRDESHGAAALSMVKCLLSSEYTPQRVTTEGLGTMWGNHFDDQSVCNQVLALLPQTSSRVEVLGFACVQVCKMIAQPEQDSLLYYNLLKKVLKFSNASRIQAQALGPALGLAAISKLPATYTLLLEFCRKHNLLINSLTCMPLRYPRIIEAFFALPESSRIYPRDIAGGLLDALEKKDYERYASICKLCEERNLLVKILGDALILANKSCVHYILGCEDAQLISNNDFSRALSYHYRNWERFSLILDHCKQKGRLGAVFLQSLLHLRLFVAFSILRAKFREKFDVKVDVR